MQNNFFSLTPCCELGLDYNSRIELRTTILRPRSDGVSDQAALS